MEPNQQDNQQTQQLDKEILKLESQLSEALSAEDFFGSAPGQLIVQLFVKEITRLTREVTSDKFRKDLSGYNTALSDLLAYKNILHRLQLAATPERKAKINEQLQARLDAEKNG